MKKWQLHEENFPGRKYVEQKTLLDKTKLYLHLLNLNLGFIKQLFKSMKKRRIFDVHKFPRMKNHKIKKVF